MGIKPESEAGFQRTLLEYAKLRGWWCYHNPDSRRSAGGLPDLILVRDGVMVLAELKASTGRLRASQKAVLPLLEAVAAASGGAVRVRVWRPEMWAEITEELT